MKHIRWFAALVALLVLTGACTRSDGDVETGTEEDPQAEASNEDEEASDSEDATALSAGGFGDLEAVCQDGDASGATATGVTDTEIRLGTVTDKGNARHTRAEQGDVRRRSRLHGVVQRAWRDPRSPARARRHGCQAE